MIRISQYLQCECFVCWYFSNILALARVIQDEDADAFEDLLPNITGMSRLTSVSEVIVFIRCRESLVQWVCRESY